MLMESHNQKAIGKYYPLFRNANIHNVGRTKTQKYVLKFEMFVKTKSSEINKYY